MTLLESIREPAQIHALSVEQLETLAAEPGRVFSREQLIARSHGESGHVTRRTVDVHVANLRKKLDPALIRTVYGVGYACAVAP